ncbi:MAG TPA: hypothetical protein DCG50_00780, partial [Elusimicrobia bacterium]|nr:hypothetical protein [Elusimicrobiota bacterium]
MKKHGSRNKYLLKAALSAALVFSFTDRAFSQAFEIQPGNVNEAEYAALKDKLSVSLFFRGEAADKILDAGLQGRILELKGGETHAQVREALINWIKKNTAEAANLYAYLSRNGAAGALPAEIEYYIYSWKINPHFSGLVNALTAAAGNKALSDETLNLAASRLFEGPQLVPESPGVGSGRGSIGEAGFFSGYADYKLNRAGLEKEKINLRDWLNALREDFEPRSFGLMSKPKGRGRPGLQPAGGSLKAGPGADLPSPLRRRLLGETLSAYETFAASASALRARSALTREESAGLEKERNSLRNKLAALTLLELAERVNRAVRGLGGEDAGLFKDAEVLSRSFEKAARNFEEGAHASGDIARVLPEAVRAGAGFCVRASAAQSLSSLRVRIRRTGFSCLYDYLYYRFFERFYPETAYVRARGVMAGAASVLSRAHSRLQFARLEDMDEDLAGEISAVSSSLEVVEKASAAN